MLCSRKIVHQSLHLSGPDAPAVDGSGAKRRRSEGQLPRAAGGRPHLRQGPHPVHLRAPRCQRPCPHGAPGCHHPRLPITPGCPSTPAAHQPRLPITPRCRPRSSSPCPPTAHPPPLCATGVRAAMQWRHCASLTCIASSSRTLQEWCSTGQTGCCGIGLQADLVFSIAHGVQIMPLGDAPCVASCEGR